MREGMQFVPHLAHWDSERSLVISIILIGANMDVCTIGSIGTYSLGVISGKATPASPRRLMRDHVIHPPAPSSGVKVKVARGHKFRYASMLNTMSNRTVR